MPARPSSSKSSQPPRAPGTPVLTLHAHIPFPGEDVNLNDLAHGHARNRVTLGDLALSGEDVLLAAPLVLNAPVTAVRELHAIALVATVPPLTVSGPRIAEVKGRARITSIIRTSPDFRALWSPAPDTELDAGAQLWSEVRDVLRYLEVVHQQIPPAQIRALAAQVERPIRPGALAAVVDSVMRLSHIPLQRDDRLRVLAELSLKARVQLVSRLFRRTFDAIANIGPSSSPPPSPPTSSPPRVASSSPARSPSSSSSSAPSPSSSSSSPPAPSSPSAPATPVVDLQTVGAALDDVVGLGHARRPILEWAAALRVSRIPKPLLLLGPAGVDKAAVGAAIARGLVRPFTTLPISRVSVADIQGAAGARAGVFTRLIAETRRPDLVVMLEDLDAVADDAVLDLLRNAIDPQRSLVVHDLYADARVDLSRSTWLATSVDVRGVAPGLRELFETVEIAGYTDDEKHRLLERSILPRLLKDAGLAREQLQLTEQAVAVLLLTYSVEPGVHDLTLAAEKLVRAAAVDVSLGAKGVRYDGDDVVNKLGAAVTDDTTTMTRRVPALEAASAPTVKTERRCGRFRLGARIGSGGMAEVFVGEADTGERVAIKRMRSEVSEEPGFRDMFLDEARLAAKLEHPHIVRILEMGLEAGAEGDVPFLVMELCRGVSLASVRRHAKTLDAEIVQALGVQMLAGLHHAHELKDAEGRALGVVHRDVSPQNLMVDEAGHVRVLDFGIARAAGRTTRTATGVVKGKVAYMAPEQLDGTDDRRADVFAAGVVLCELLCNERPTSGDDIAVMRQLLRREVAPPLALAVVPDGLRNVITRALHPVMEKRYATALEMAHALAKAVPYDDKLARIRLGELVRAIGEPAAVTSTHRAPRTEIDLEPV